MAIWRRDEPDALHHSDRGSQYTHAAFQKPLSNHGILLVDEPLWQRRDNAAIWKASSRELKTKCTARKIYRNTECF